MLAFLSNVRLTITQWVLFMAAGTIGALVLLLSLKKSALHKSQLLLLQEQYKNALGGQEKNVEEAKTRLQEALRAYRE